MKMKGLYFSCQIGSLPSDFFEVTEFTLKERLSELFTLTLDVSSEVGIPLELSDLLLMESTLTITTEGIHRRTITGYIESAQYIGTNVHRIGYQLVIRPKLWILTLEQDSRIFHFKTIPEILKQLLDEMGIEADCQFFQPHAQREYVTQKRESNYDFFVRLAAEEGINFWYEDNKLFYSDSFQGMKLLKGSVIFNPHIQSAHREMVMNEMHFMAKMKPTEMVQKDYFYSHPRVELMYDAEPDPKEDFGKFSVYDSYGRYTEEKIGKQFTRYRLEAMRSDSALGHGKSNIIELRPGLHFPVLEHPYKEMNRKWQVIEVVHVGKLPQALGKESGSKAATLTNRVEFAPNDKQWRLAHRHKPLVDGDEVAMVVGPKGEEIYVNEDGCVRVHFHWNRYDEADEKASCWVRVAQGWNGDGFGILSIPRIGQEVVITYLNGDIDKPLIIGTTYNGMNRPPLSLPKEKTRLTIKTKTHKGDGFNELRFEDEKEQEEIFIHAQKDMNTKVLHDRTTTVLNDHVETVHHDQTINIYNDRNKDVHKDETVNIHEKQMITVHGEKGQHITVVHDRVLDVLKNQKTTVIESSTHQSRDTTFTADNFIKLICGKSSLEMKSDGTIELKGCNIVIEASEKLHGNGVKEAIIEGAILKLNP